MSYKKHGGEGGGDGGDKGGDEGHTPSCTRAKFQELLAQVKDLRFELSAEVSDLLANEDLDLRNTGSGPACTALARALECRSLLPLPLPASPPPLIGTFPSNSHAVTRLCLSHANNPDEDSEPY